jgi:hypothetical protein
MLISAKYENDKIVAQHVQNIAGIPEYCRELSKDESNGFTKDRSMRRVGSFPSFTLMEYDRLHPGWYARASQTKDLQDRQKAWREFLSSDYAKPFMMVEKLKH